MINRLLILAGASGLLPAPPAAASCSRHLTATALNTLSRDRTPTKPVEISEHLLTRLLPDVVLQVKHDPAVSQLRFRLVRKFGLGEVTALRLEAFKYYRRIYTWEFRHLRHPESFALDVLPLDDGWLAELQAKSEVAAECVQVFLKFSRRGVLETVTIAPAEAPGATLPVTYPHD